MDHYVTPLINAAVIYAPKIVMAILTLIVGFWLANKLAALVRHLLLKRNADRTVVPFLSSIVSVLLKVMVLISVAGMFGIETTSFVALIASAGLAVGLALQGSLGHFASGVLLLTFRPYKVGDLVSVAGHTGEVEEIQIFNTILKTLDNKRIIIPNGAITSAPMINISGQGIIRVDMQYNVSGAENIDKVIRVVNEVAASCPYLLADRPVDVLVNSQEIGITKFDVRPWCKSEHYWDTYYYMQEHIKRQFVQQGVLAPTPAMNVHMAS